MNFIPITSYNVESQIRKDLQSNCKIESFDLATDLSTKYLNILDPESLIKLSFNDNQILSTDDVKPMKSKQSKSGNKKSFVWKYFAHPKIINGIEDRSRTECLECKSQLAFNASGTTTTMLNHLKSRHPKIAECEEWRKLKMNSNNAVNGGDLLSSVTKNSESPTGTLSPSASFDFPKTVTSSPDHKNLDLNVLSMFPNAANLYNNYSDQNRLICLTNLIPHPLMVTSCLPTTNNESMNSYAMTTMDGGNLLSTIHSETNDHCHNNGFGSLDTNNNCFDNYNRSTVKRKRKKPQNKQTCMNTISGDSYDMTSGKFEKLVKHDPSDLSSIQSITAISRNSAAINNLLYHNFISNDTSNTIYNDGNNNNLANVTPFQALKSLSTFTMPLCPRSPIASKMGISESDRIIVYWLIKDLRPYSVLEETGMKTLFSCLMPSVTIPSISNLKNRIFPSIYWSLKAEILNEFSSESGAAFSIELWDNAINNGTYASVKLNFYSNKNRQLQSKMIVTKEINAKHLCSDLLLSCCNEVGIDFSKIQFVPVVMNSHESMNDELANVGEIEQNKKFIIIPCLMSSLQEVAKVGLQEPEVMNLLDKCRALKELADAYNLQLDNYPVVHNVLFSSKYSSEKFELIYWVYRNLEQIIEKLDCLNPERFNKDDEIFLRQLTPLLEHIYQTLNVVEQNKLFFSASMIKSIILTMNKSPFQPKESDHRGVIQFKIAVKNRLCKIYPLSGQLHDILSISTVLDPRFKKYQDSDESVMLQELRNEITNSSEGSASSVFLQDSSNSVKREDLSSIFGEDCFAQEPKSEVDQYLNEHKIDIEKNPIKWWHDNAARFPNLSKLALRYLCIPLANQYGSESTEFDSIVYIRRKEIEPDEIDHYIFLNHNWR